MNRFKRLCDEALARAEKEPRAPAPTKPRGPGKRTSKVLLAQPIRIDHAGGLGGFSPIRDRMPGANDLEVAYGAFLDHQKAMGEVLEWYWQPMSLRLTFLEDGRGDFYRPDFLVVTSTREIQIHETKGFMQDDARTKLKVAAALYPFRFVLVQRKGGVWERTRYVAALP